MAAKADMRPKLTSSEPIAVIGSACRFPGDASNPSKLWELLREPRDVQMEIPPERFHLDGFFHPTGSHHGTSNVRHSYLLTEDCQRFDAHFFGIKPTEANSVDPQQRLLLETTYESIESAGLRLEKLRGSDTAVYVGLMCGDYADLLLRDPEAFPTYIATGTARSIMSNRISYFFDWHGPSMTIDTACSSSLVAVHHAVQALRSGTSKIAIAGGSNLCLGPEPYIGESNLSMLSPTGRSRMWDSKADGYARGDGVAAVVLKTLSSALSDGDHVECVIRETGVNQDGRTHGITMPSAQAQKLLIRETYARAGLDLNRPQDRCQYFEAHGTGTPTGDPLEAEAINSAFFPPEYRQATNPLYVGSIKTVIGHTEGTAGLAGLIKTSLALQAARIPPNMLFDELSPKVAPFYKNLKIVTGTARPWPKVAQGEPRRASLNSFGFGGTNAHAILESYDPGLSRVSSVNVPNFLPLIFTAVSEAALVNSLEAYYRYIQNGSKVDVRSLAWTLNFRRSQFGTRTSLSASSLESLGSKIHKKLEDIKNLVPGAVSVSSKKRAKNQRKPLLGVFTGQGAQWTGMMKEILKHSNFAQSRLRVLDLRLAELPKEDRPTWSLLSELTNGCSRMNEAVFSQPLCTAVQIVLVDILRAANVKLDAVIGHSSGEIGAAYAAGIISAEDAICIAYYRGVCSRLAAGRNGEAGAMMAVGMSAEDISDLCDIPELQGRLSIAASNSSTSYTLSGDAEAVQLAADILADEGKFARKLVVDKAYHSHHMHKCTDAYLKALDNCHIKICSRAADSSPVWYSSVKDAVMTSDNRELVGTYWNDNMVSPVLFTQAAECAAAGSGPFAMAIEIGPHAALKGPVTQIMSELLETPLPYASLLDRKKHDLEAVADGFGALVDILGWRCVNLQKLDQTMSEAPKPALVKDLPQYGWNHGRRYWQESRLSRAYRGREAFHSLLGARTTDSTEQEFRWRNFLSPRELPWLTGHMIQGQMVFPAAGYMSACIEAARAISRDNEVRLIELTDIKFGQALVFEGEDAKVETLFSITDIQHQQHTLKARFVFYSAASASSNTLIANANGKIVIVYGPGDKQILPDRKPELVEAISVPEDRFYDVLGEIGYGYTGPFRALTGLKRRIGETTGLARIKDHELSDLAKLSIDPAMLDATIQSVMLAKSWPGDGELWCLHVPQRIKRVIVNLVNCPNADCEAAYFETTMGDSHDRSGITSDIRVFPENSQHAMVQMEGLVAVPLDIAAPDNDKLFFSSMVWDLSDPDAMTVAFDGKASQSDYDLAYVLERVAHFYLKRFNDAFDPRHISRREGPYVGLLRYATHIAQSVATGQNLYAKPEWVHDDTTTIGNESRRFPENVDLRIMHVIGKHMPAVIKGEANILEYLKEGNLLDIYYEQAMGISYYTKYLARLAATLVHRYPHMNILEVGAGTGHATKPILEATSATFKSYTFTDISNGFFENARSAFQTHESKMIFKVLDLESDISTQGFVPHSYDLVIASFVLHATSRIRETMANVRNLLKPGGYLLMLEVTNLEQSRLGFIFGSLPGWWLGAEDKRILSPCLAKEQWDEVLRGTGFSGVDSATPDLDTLPFPASAIVSQAIDTRIKFLRQPLVAPYAAFMEGPAISNLVVVGGNTEQSTSLVSQLKNTFVPHTGSITQYQTVDDIAAGNIPLDAITVMLADIDRPIFLSLTQNGLDGLRSVYDRSSGVFWVTQGSRAENPHQNQSLGFVRSMTVEMAHVRSQIIDTDQLENSSAAEALCEHLIRFSVADELDAQETRTPILWSSEPELAIENGKLLIPRIKPGHEQNDRYNAARRAVYKSVDFNSMPLELVARGNTYLVQQSTLPDLSAVHFVTISVQKSLSAAVSVRDKTALFLVCGVLTGTNTVAIAFSESNASVVRVPKNWVTLSLEPVTFTLLHQIARHIVASRILHDMSKGQLLLALDTEYDLLAAIQVQAAARGIRVSVLYSNSDHSVAPPGLPSAFLNPHSTDKEFSAKLPVDVSVIFQANEESRLQESVTECRSPTCVWRYGADMMSVTSQLDEPKRSTDLSSMLRTAYRNSVGGMAKITKLASPPVSSLSDIQRQIVQKTTTHMIDWTAEVECSLAVQTIHDQTRLDPEKSYWLVGLTGSLGISLCHWMIRHGAQTIVFTSRNPRIDDRVLEELKRTGATIKIFAADVTSRQSLNTIYQQLVSELPPIAGVVQGAMVLHDSMLVDMTVDKFNSVLAPKVDGSKNLDELFSKDTLDFFVMFSSATCVTGNIGQSNYSVANMFMTSLARQRQKRGLAGSVINIGAILGVGYVTRETSQELQNNLLKSGHVWMSERDFHTLFAEALLAGSPGAGLDPELNSGLRIINTSDAQRPLWSYSPKFQHLVRDEIEQSNPGNRKADTGISVRHSLAAADTPEMAIAILRETFVVKLTAMLQLDESTPSENVMDSRAEDLGIDSLNAVEIRSWILKNLKVDIPVLRILGGSTIGELLVYILEKVPADLVPLLEADRHVRKSNATVAAPVLQATASNASDQASTKPEDEETESDIDTDPDDLDYDFMEDEDSEEASSNPVGLAKVESLHSSQTISIEITGSSTDGSNNNGSDSIVFLPTGSDSLTADPPDEPVLDLQAPRAPGIDKHSLQKVLPMSHAQSHFWFLKHYVEDQSTFNVTATLEINGPLRQADLERAVMELGQHHEALRTCLFFDQDSKQPLQGVLKESLLRLEVKTYANDEERRLESQMVCGYKYDLEAGEIMRILLIKPTSAAVSRASYLIIGYHHINMDGSSFQLVLSDLMTLYSHKRLNANVLQYPEYASRQHKQLERGEWAADLAYWKKHLAELPAVFPLLPVASVRQRQPLKQYNHHTAELRLNRGLGLEIRTFCKQAKISPYHFYLTTFRVLMARISGTQELCIGIADAGRIENDTLTAVGLYLNQLPLRTTHQPTQSFSAAAKEVRSSVYAAMAHSRPPFAAVLAALNVPRSASHSPLFQTFVDYRQAVEEKQIFDGLIVEGREYEVGRTAYDVALDVLDNPKGEALIIMAVQVDLYSSDAAALLLRCYLNLMEQFCRDPSMQVGNAMLYPKADIQKALQVGRGETKASQWEKTLSHQVDRMARQHPNNLAVKDGTGKTLTYREMMRRAECIIAALSQLNLSPGSNVGVFQDAGVHWICSMIAIMKAGHVYVPLDLKVGVQRLALAVQDCKPSTILFDNTTHKQLHDIGAVASNHVNVEDIAFSGAHLTSSNHANPEAAALILYTSGSTGTPKGAVLSHAGIRNNIEGNTEEFQIGPSDYGLQQISLSFDFSVWQIFMCLANGAGLYLAPRDVRGDPKALTEVIVSEGITFTGATPSEYMSWLRYGNTTDLRASSWVRAVSSGEQMSDVMKHQFAALSKPDLHLWNGYGPTEGSFSSAKVAVDYQDEQEAARNTTPGGYIQPNYSIYILDEQNSPVPCGVEGQIAIAGASVALGYLNNDILTGERFITDSFATEEYRKQGWTRIHLTGDRGILLPNGLLTIQGRISGDTQVKLRGLRIDLSDIEAVIAQTGGSLIQDVIVSLRSVTEEDGKESQSGFLVAHVVLSTDVAQDKRSELLETLQRSLPLPQYMVPSVFAPLDHIPLNAHLKRDRQAARKLPLPEKSKKHMRQLDTNMKAMEKSVAAIWKNVIPSEVMRDVEITKTSDFFLVGGDSLLLIKLRDEIHKTFGVDLPLVQFFEASMLESMAARIQAITGSDVPEPEVGSASEPEEQPVAAKSLVSSKTSPLAAPITNTGIDWEYETRLPTLPKPPRSNESIQQKKQQPQTVILTGATGFLGKAILNSLVQDDRIGRVHCIAVRQPKTLKDDIFSNNKITVHQGDLGLPFLGLDKVLVETIFTEATTIIHNGADVSFLKPYASLRMANVESTREIVRLAAAHSVSIHYVSTAGVVQFASSARHKAVPEESLARSPPRPDLDLFRNSERQQRGMGIAVGYAASKWASEVLLEKASTQHRIPVTIHRPANVTSDGSAWGASEPTSDLVDSLLQYSRRIGAVPLSESWGASDGELDFISLGTVVEGILEAMLDVSHESMKPLTFLHHSGEVRIPLRDVKSYLERQTGSTMRVLPLEAWVTEAEMAGLNPLIAEILIDAERQGGKYEFPKVGKGNY